MNVNEWPGVSTLREALRDLLANDFSRLRAQVVDAGLNPNGPEIHEFEGLTANDGGLDVLMSTTRSDGRVLVWLVEVWIFTDRSDRYANVKGEIDLDDDNGEDRCVLNEQRRADDPADAVVLLRELATEVVEYPVAKPLTMPWPAPEDARSATTEHAERLAAASVEGPPRAVRGSVTLARMVRW